MDITENNYNTDFENLKIADKDLKGYLFEDCNFSSCVFDQISFEDVIFTSCIFIKCSFIMTSLNGTTMNDVFFNKCRLMGLNFTNCNEFLLNISFEQTILENIFISDKKLKKLKLSDCKLKDCDFMRIDFLQSNFSNSDFTNVTFSDCNLEKADFRASSGYFINPETNKIKNALFSLPEAQSFLTFLNIKIE